MSMGVTVFLGVLVGIVIVAQTLYTSAVEHIKEFGTVKAIGGSNLDIYRILGEQALVAAFLGFALGALFSYLARPLMAAIHLNVLLTPGFSAVVFAGTVLDVPGRRALQLPARGERSIPRWCSGPEESP